ncbi:hypothetical protein N0V84_012407 [Fusarium piperis]|uniref:Uncharacterized protein n=1 Tax=Fusarium piperis TaxID=1435070 RepID=A0A9W8T9E2_9HYPO|nr:hypothetical protein N0V84_012407 [Fusarium piperis]
MRSRPLAWQHLCLCRPVPATVLDYIDLDHGYGGYLVEYNSFIQHQCYRIRLGNQRHKHQGYQFIYFGNKHSVYHHKTSAIPGTTTSDFTTITTTTSQAPIPTVSQTFEVKAAQSDNTAVNGAVLHVTNNPSYALYLISPPRTSGSVLPGAFSIEEGTSRLMVGEWYVYTNAPDPYSMYAGPASSVGPNQAYVSCTKPELVGEALQCSSATAGPIYFSVSSTATGSTNIMPWKVGSVHAGYSAVNLVAG